MQVSKWGNSLAVRLPRNLVQELGLKAGDEVSVVAGTGKAIALETRDDRRQRALDRMAARNWSRPEGFGFDRDEANAR